MGKRSGLGEKEKIVRDALLNGERNRDVIAERANCTSSYVYNIAKRCGVKTYVKRTKAMRVQRGSLLPPEKMDRAIDVLMDCFAMYGFPDESDEALTARIKTIVKETVRISDKTADEVLGAVYLSFLEKPEPKNKPTEELVTIRYGTGSYVIRKVNARK